MRYYLWRLAKPNATRADRLRTRKALLGLFAQCSGGGFDGIAEVLQDDTLPLEVITQTTDLIIESHGAGATCAAQLPLAIVPSLWNMNPDARRRIQDALVYMANSDQIALKPGLAEWKPGAQDSAEVIDTKVKLWENALGKPIQSAGISGESRATAPSQSPSAR